MGYTTSFSGEFTLDRQLQAEHAEGLFDLADSDSRELPTLLAEGAPAGYCQWRPTRRLDGIEWDGNEKFYDYVEWLQFIIDRRLKPWGYALSGSVVYNGEEAGDCGALAIVNGVVKQFPAVDLGDPVVFAEAVEAAVAAGEGVKSAVLRLLSDRSEQGY